MAEHAKLTPKQQRFVAEYLVDLNGKQAAIRAGYSAKTAEVQASRLLSKAKVQAAAQARRRAQLKRIEVTADRVIEEVARIAFSNMMDYLRVGSNGDPYIDLSELTRDRAAAISEIIVDDFMVGRGEDARQVRRVRFKLHDKQAALMNLAKLKDMIVGKSEKHHSFRRELAKMMREQRRARLAELLERAARLPLPAKAITETGEDADGRE